MLLSETEDHAGASVIGRVRIPGLTQSETPCMWRSPLCGTREISQTSRYRTRTDS
jgi:hypothetical protein